MFRKPIKIKSNNQLKGSERKSFKEKLLKAFPNLVEMDLDGFIAKKDVISNVRVVTATDETVQVYVVQKTPLVFDYKGRLVPTIFFLWKFPESLPVFTIHSQILNILTSGADLMLPGVVTPPTNSGLPKYANIARDELGCVNCTENKAAIAVGVVAQSSSEMLASAGRGKCLTILHILGDKLCHLEGLNAPLPNHGPPDWLKFSSYEEDFPELGAQKSKSDTSNVQTAQSTMKAKETEQDSKTDSAVESQPTTEQMDELLMHCFLVAIKYSKTLTLPILTSNLYKLQMIPVCPPGQVLDIKKTSYKKLKGFLDHMSKEGLITVKEMKKGVESLTAINKGHPKFVKFCVDPDLRPKEETPLAPMRSVTETFTVTPTVLPIFKGFNKGDVVQMGQVRQSVADYIKLNNCQDEQNLKMVKPNEVLRKICKSENCITWEEMINKVCDAMKSCYKVTSGNEQLVNKGKVAPISLTVSQRSGNKKVTLVDNLELFGISITEFAKECQHGLSTGTSISKPPGKKCDQLLVQGNQVLFIHKLLTEKYKIPKRYITGLENAPTKKKK